MKKQFVLIFFMFSFLILPGCSHSQKNVPRYSVQKQSIGNQSLSSPPGVELKPGKTQCKEIRDSLGDPFAEIRSNEFIRFLYWFESYGIAKSIKYAQNSMTHRLTVIPQKTDRNIRQLDLFFSRKCVFRAAYYISSFP